MQRVRGPSLNRWHTHSTESSLPFIPVSLYIYHDMVPSSTISQIVLLILSMSIVTNHMTWGKNCLTCQYQSWSAYRVILVNVSRRQVGNPYLSKSTVERLGLPTCQPKAVDWLESLTCPRLMWAGLEATLVNVNHGQSRRSYFSTSPVDTVGWLTCHRKPWTC